MRFFDCTRSSAAYRVRIALALKGLSPERELVDIHKDDPDHHTARYGSINPQRLVPSLGVGDGRVITQSLAIIEYLDDARPETPLLPINPEDRALARSIALSIACDIHPFGTPRVARFLSNDLGVRDSDLKLWVRHWIRGGLEAVDRLIASRGESRFAVGNAPTIADIFIVPQVVVAERQGIDISDLKALSAIVSNARRIEAFVETAPDFQRVPA